MEKFFKVKKENHIYDDYFKWWNNLDNVKRKWEQFRKLVGIESSQFLLYEELSIIPTDNDLKKFEKSFTKSKLNNGLRKFKKNSIIQKDWEKFVKNNITIMHKPTIVFDFFKSGVYGKTSSRLFHYKNDLYTSLNADFPVDFEVPEGYEEIKGSEFYKIIEIIENKEDE